MPVKKSERVQEIPLSELHPFKNHPFRVVDDEAMQRTVESVAQFGVLAPALARPRPEGGYELVAGHRRMRASELAGLETLLPSERAFAYKMKMEAMKHQGERTDLTSGQLGRKSDGKESREIIAEQTGESARQVQRFINLINLIPELLDMVDRKEIAFNPAVELSFLKKEEQQGFLEAMDYGQSTPSLSQAQRIKKLSQAGMCTQEAMNTIMNEEKKSELDTVTLKNDVLRKYFPRSYTPKQMQDTIIRLLEQWQKKRQRDQSR